MRQAGHQLTVATPGRGLVEITDPVVGWLDQQRIVAGLLTLFCRHSSASLLIQENADPDVRADLEAFFERIAPEAAGRYIHDAEGPDDMPSHIRAALTQTQIAIPIMSGRLVLGTGRVSICSSTGARRTAARSCCMSWANSAGRFPVLPPLSSTR